MDNVKKFEDFLDRMQGLLDNAKKQGHIVVRVEDLENTFPELKESEGERIRYALISQFNDYQRRGENHGFGYSNEEILAWLEKQGEQNVANNVMPRFKVGDWVVFNNKHQSIYQVKKIEDGYYILRHTHGGRFRECVLHDESLRLWAIQDAKDGDVLVNGSNIFIFHFINDTRLMGYCHVNTDDGRFYDDIGRNECFCLIDAVVNPATKEQREQLEKAMADAGYTFDFNKKELKKIEQKLSENVKPQSSTPMSYGKELEERMYEACNRFNAPNTDPNRYSAADLFYAGVKADRDLNTHALSEEDLYKIEHALFGTYAVDTTTRILNKIKSLKPQNRWKPSDEQMRILSIYADQNNTHGAVLTSLYQDLKKVNYPHLKEGDFSLN